MRVKQPLRPMPICGVGELTAPEKKQVSAIIKRLDGKAVSGVPYAATLLIDEIALVVPNAPIRLASAAIKALQRERSWWCRWGAFGRGDGEVTLRQVLDASLTRGVAYSPEQVSEWLLTLMGEQVKSNTVSKTLARLVATGRFSKVENQYTRTHRGF